MKIIFDNIIFSLQKSGGISVYWYELLKRYLTDENNDHNDIAIYQFHNAKTNLFANKLRETISFKSWIESALALNLLRYLDFRKKIQPGSIFHSSYYRHAPGAINIVTIYDFTYRYYRQGLARFIHTWQQGRAIKNAAAIVCISDQTKNDLFKFYPQISVPVKVIYMGKSDEFHVLNRDYKFSDQVQFLVDQKFYLFIGDRQNYKNFIFMLEQLQRVQKDKYLIIVGGGDLNKEEQFLLNKQLANHYFHFKRPDIQQLNELYNLAFCLLYPSDYEGFGIPVIEAMAAGCPVICQSVSSLGEVAGDAGIYFKKQASGNSQDSFQHALSLLEDKQFYQQMVSKGLENAHQFSWDKCYQQTIELYHSFAGG